MNKKLIVFLPVIAILFAILIVLLLIDTNEHIHIWYEKEVLLDATCTNTGEKVLSCECGEIKTEIIPITHKWDTVRCEDEQICTLCEKTQTNTQKHILDFTTQKCKNCNSCVINLKTPTYPLTINEYEYDEDLQLVSSFNISDINWKYESGVVTINLTGSKTFTVDSFENLKACKITYKILDDEGYTVKSGTINTIPLFLNDKIKNLQIEINDLPMFKEYTLELYDYISKTQK